MNDYQQHCRKIIKPHVKNQSNHLNKTENLLGTCHICKWERISFQIPFKYCVSISPGVYMYFFLT